jgi:hypothetical protein
VLGTIVIASDKRKGTGVIATHLPFPTAINLSAATNYRLIVKPTTTSTIALYEYSAASAALREAFPMGVYRQLTTGAPGGWTETNTSYGPDMGLILDAFDDAGGGGGGGGGGAFTFAG